MPNKSRNTPYVRITRTRKFEPCYCRACKGKLVDPRTKKNHAKRKNIPQREFTFESLETSHNSITSDPEDFIDIDAEYDHDPQEESYQFLVKRKPVDFQKNRTSVTSHLEVVSELFSDDNDKPEEDNEFEEEFDLSSSDDELEKDCQVDFTTSEIEVEQDNFVQSEDLDDNFSWIIIWILKYQEKHRLPNVAIDSLFKLFRYVLINLPNQTSFVTFPTSLYMARKKLGMCVHLIKYAACKECCKLYQISDVSSNDPNITPKFTKCIFQDFPNHSKSYGRKPCETPLYKNICTKNGGFEESCKKWINRHSDPEILTDIYNGRMWKSFKDEDGSLFFRTDLADAHLGLMLSMDCFDSGT
ncbi:unnamed protein product [Rhizophagus irregularis]|nr:unnamed protein product [Rhizophagus irregularis]